MQTWNFDDQLAMIFLAGEPVADFALRFRKEYDASRLWVSAYSNDVPTYVPSKRIWDEGGYEGAVAFIYADHPARFGEATEALVFAAVHEMIPPGFLGSATNAGNPATCR